MQRIFCVEDDEHIRELITYALNSSGFDALGFENYKRFSKVLLKSKPDLIILDIMLPDLDGISILKELRLDPLTKHISVILLTAKSMESDKIKGLDLGADDYVTKPFSVLELISRVKAVLRRNEPIRNDKIIYKNIEMDLDSRDVLINGSSVPLTFKEFELLHFLIKNKGIVLSREKLMNEIWGYEFEGETRTVDVHIRTLRQKLGESGSMIETVRNIGYKVIL